MLTITYQDHVNKIQKEELQSYLKEKKEILDRVKNNSKGYEDVLGWMNPEEWASDAQISILEEKAREVREYADAFVLIGVGGSNNAARSVIKALNPQGPKVYYAGNTISPYEVNCLLKELEGKSVYINVIAKNFETLEPGIGFRVFNFPRCNWWTIFGNLRCGLIPNGSSWGRHPQSGTGRKRHESLLI